MARERFISFLECWSDPDKDVVNHRKNGIPDHEELFHTKRILDEICAPC